MSLEPITLGAQTSADDDRSMPHVLAMRRLLAQLCKGPYSSEVDEFALIFRIGGEMQEFDFEGCQRLRRSTKERYISVDLGFPSWRWREKSPREIRTFVAESVGVGVRCCIDRLARDGTPIDADKLLADVSRAQSAYLSGN